MKDIWKSKKFKSALAAFATTSAALIARRYGCDLSHLEIGALAAPFLGYTLSQGLADFGKEAKK